jgi:hypothetical protein
MRYIHVDVGQVSTNCLDQAMARYQALVSIIRAMRGSPGSCHFSFLSIFSRINIL